MISKKRLILNISFFVIATVALIIALTADISDVAKYILAGTLFMLSAILSIFNSFNKKKY